MKALKRFSIVFVSVFIFGCATTVQKKEDLFTTVPDQKECYSYDTAGRSAARNTPTAVGMGILGGIFPPLLIFTSLAAGASAAADQAALPAKCGLTFNDAIKEAYSVSFYEKATAIWSQKSGSATIVVSYVDGDEKCSNHKIVLRREESDLAKTFTETMRICKNSNGEPVIEEVVIAPAS